MQLSVQDIERVATLARLALTEQEKKRYADQLSAVFDYVEMLNGVDTNGVPETCQVTGLEDVTRADEAVPTDPALAARIKNQFPVERGGYLQVKAVFAEAD